ncbi:MAG: hypothetical protein K2Y30_16050 [Flavobacteriaceae bacterium]|nr:hypothetical protein [Flavobacteriaceae bacterium]
MDSNFTFCIDSIKNIESKAAFLTSDERLVIISKNKKSSFKIDQITNLRFLKYRDLHANYAVVSAVILFAINLYVLHAWKSQYINIINLLLLLALFWGFKIKSYKHYVLVNLNDHSFHRIEINV